ncbi:MAG: hypothetical protein M3M84_03800 [Thermoproteota archaeon]|nr:hypothetical protein [Thermoproteota archaeon]
MLLTEIKVYFIMNVTADGSQKFKGYFRYASKNVLSRMAKFRSRYLAFYEYFYRILIGFVIGLG